MHTRIHILYIYSCINRKIKIFIDIFNKNWYHFLVNKTINKSVINLRGDKKW